MRLASVVQETDIEMRAAALQHVRDLQRLYDELIPVDVLRAGFLFHGQQISYGSFFKGIFRPRQMRGPAALAIVTTAPKAGRPAPYEDDYDAGNDQFVYRFRDALAETSAARSAAEADNRALIAAHEMGVPLIYFRGIFPGQYAVVAPAFITSVDRSARLVALEVGLPIRDVTDAGLVSDKDVRQYATREAVVRLHQQRFRAAVMAAYTTRCAVCHLREASLLQASHIIGDREADGHATVINGIALCAIHHLAYDRNLMGIDPRGVVHIAKRLLDEVDGPMLRTGLQGFHGATILQPRRRDERPDPARLDVRFAEFRAA